MGEFPWRTVSLPEGFTDIQPNYRDYNPFLPI